MRLYKQEHVERTGLCSRFLKGIGEGEQFVSKNFRTFRETPNKPSYCKGLQGFVRSEKPDFIIRTDI